MMSRVSGSIEIGPRGLFGFFQPLKISIVLSGSSLPFCCLIASKLSAVPSHEPTERKLGVPLAPYSRFHAAMKASLAGRAPAADQRNTVAAPRATSPPQGSASPAATPPGPLHLPPAW